MSDAIKLILALAVVAGAALAFWLLGEEANAPGLERGENVEQGGAREPSMRPRREAADREEPPTGVRSEPDEIEAGSTDQDRSASPEGTGLLVRGSIEIIDLEGRPLPKDRLEGRLVLTVLRDGGREKLELDCRDGHIATLCEDWTTIRAVVLEDPLRGVGPDERVAVFDYTRFFRSEDFTDPPADGDGEAGRQVEVAGRARLVPRIELHVVDAATGVLLDQMRVLVPAERNDVVHPGDLSNARLVAAGDSPLTIDPADCGNNVPHYVEVRGYALGMITFDRRSEGERRLALEPGGALEILIESPLGPVDDDHDLRLRIRDHEQSGESSITVGGRIVTDMSWKKRERFSIANLPTGRFEVALETGDAYRPEVVTASETVEIRAGATTILRLAPEIEALITPLASASGKFLRPEGEREKVGYTVMVIRSKSGGSLESQMVEPVEAGEAEIPFGPIKLRPGSHTVSYAGQEYDFELSTSGRDDLVFRLRSRRTIELVLRRPDGTFLEDSRQVRWRGAGLRGRARWDARRRAYLMNPRAGRVTISVRMPGGDLEAVVEVDHSSARVEAKLDTEQRFRLTFTCDGVVIPHGFDLGFTLTDAEGKRVSVGTTMIDNDRVIRELEEPGRYTITVHGPPSGFRTPQTQTFEVKGGETAEVLIELERDN